MMMPDGVSLALYIYIVTNDVMTPSMHVTATSYRLWSLTLQTVVKATLWFVSCVVSPSTSCLIGVKVRA